MSKRVACLVLLLATLLAQAAVSPTGQARAAGPVRVLLVGDSVTHGSAGDWTWRYRLWAHLTGTGTAVDLVGPRDDLYDNLSGVSGSQAYLDPGFDRDHAARWGQTVAFEDTPVGGLVTTYAPDVVVEMLGLNDLIYLGNTPQHVVDDLHAFVLATQAADPEVDLVLGRLTQTWFAGVPTFNDLLSSQAPAWATTGSRISVADADAGYDREQDTWDTSHPSSRGEQKIAAAVADSLSALGIGTPYPRPLAVLPLGPRRAPSLAVTAGDRTALLTWVPAPGADGEYAWVQDRTAGAAWKRLPARLGGTSWQATGLVEGHRYAWMLQPAKGTQVAGHDIRSSVVEVVPRPRPVTDVAALSPSKDVVTVTGRGTPEATSYRVSVYRVSSCAGPAPTGFDVVRTGLAAPRARLTPTAAYLWVRLRSVRMGVTSGLDPTSTVCLHVR